MWDGFFKDQVSEPASAASKEYFTVSSYGYFSFSHLISIVIAFYFVAFLLILCFRKKSWERAALGISSVVVVCSMLGCLLYALVTGIYNIEWYVPLHICNVFGILLPLSFFSKKIKNLFMDYIVWFGIGGGVCAIVFPVTTSIYLGVLHPVSIMVWLHHLAILSLGGYYVVSGLYRKLNIYPMLSVLTLLIIGSAFANHYTGSNFLFFNPNRAVLPMSAFTYLFGTYGVFYVISSVYVVFFMLSFIYRILFRRRKHTIRQLLQESWFIRRVAASKQITETLSACLVNLKSGGKKIQQLFPPKVVEMSERFFRCVKDSEILLKLFDSQLGELTDSDYLANLFVKSGLVNFLATEFRLSELKRLNEIPCEELALLPSGRSGALLICA